MSKWLEDMPDGTYKETIADIEGCKHMYNEVCCNDKCDQCCDYPHPKEYCKRCEYFEPEDK